MTFRRRLLFPLIAGIAMIFELGALVFLLEYRAITGRVESNLGRAVDVSIASVDPTALQTFHADAEDVSAPSYQRLRARLAGLERIFSPDGIRGLYFMRVGVTSTVFLVDSAAVNDPWHSEPGVVYRQPPPAVEEVALSGQRKFTGPYTDEYGRYYSIFDVVRDQTGGVIAVVGADVEAAAYNAALLKEIVPSILILLLIAVIYAFVLYSVLKLRETMRSLREKSDALEQKNQQLEHEKTVSEENSAKLSVLIEQLPLGVSIVEPKKGRPLIANKKAVEILGRPIDKKAGIEKYSSVYDATTRDGSPYPVKEFPVAITLATGRLSVKSDIFIHRPTDGVRALRVISAPIRSSMGKVTAIAVVIEDVTAEDEADRRKNEFISIASHQLRTPLSAVKWFLELFDDPKNGKLSKEHREYLKEINGAVQRLVDLVNQLLNVSRLEAGTVGVMPVMTDVKELVESIVKETEPLCAAKELTFTHGRIPKVMLKIDPKLVREVCVNFLSNAVKYTPEGGQVKLSLEIREKDVRIIVSDTGIGIPSEQQNHIFKKFFRAQNATMTGVEGTGLGLYIAKEAAEMSGGSIGFTSEEGKGSTFWFTLPLRGSVEKHGEKPLEKTEGL